VKFMNVYSIFFDGLSEGIYCKITKVSFKKGTFFHHQQFSKKPF